MIYQVYEWTSPVFSNALSDIPTHNYINAAYHKAKVHHLCPPYDWHWNVPAVIVPLRVRKLLDAKVLFEQLKESIEKARTTIEEGNSYLDHEITRRIYYSPDGPHPWMHSTVVVTRHEREGYASGLGYTFNPYQLALALLEGYETFIDEISASRLVPFTQIGRVHRQARLLGASESLVSSEMSYHDMEQWPKLVDGEAVSD